MEGYLVCMLMGIFLIGDCTGYRISRSIDIVNAASNPDDQSVVIQDSSYGKSLVKLVQHSHLGDKHFIKEIEVNTAISLRNYNEYFNGDNSEVISTDSQKNAVYVLAARHGVRAIEEFAQIVAAYFLEYEQVTQSRIEINEIQWTRLENPMGVFHNHAFKQEHKTIRNTVVTNDRSTVSVTSGIKGLKLLKATQSGFTNFFNDEFRTLPDMDDRVFCSVIDATWEYTPLASTDDTNTIDYAAIWELVFDRVVDGLVGNAIYGVYSPSVQQTIHDIAVLVLNDLDDIESIHLTMPNVHMFPFEFDPKFNITSVDGHIYRIHKPLDAPSGMIDATLTRSDMQQQGKNGMK